MAKGMCPRCNENTYNTDGAEVYPALSRRDSKTYICPSCGREEGLIDNGFKEVDDREIAFVAKVKK